MEDIREFGVIASRKENFGFIKRTSSSLDVFFHVSSILEGSKNDFKPGKCVEYIVSKDPSSGRLLAKHLKLAPDNSVKFFSVSSKRQIGQIIKTEASSGSSILVRYVEGNKPKLLSVADATSLIPGSFVYFKVQTDIRSEEAAVLSGAKPYTYLKAVDLTIISDTDTLPQQEALEVTILKLVQDYKENVQNSKSAS